jgi:hypothetical protein
MKADSKKLRVFYLSTDNTLNEFFGKHRADIESIHSGIIDEAGIVTKIIIFDGVKDTATGHLYSEKIIFNIDHVDVTGPITVGVNASNSELDSLVRTFNLIK